MPFYPPVNDSIKKEDPYQEVMALFNAMDEVFFSYDFINRRLVKISNACEKLFGYTTDTFLADSAIWFQLVHPGDKPITVNEYKTLVNGKYVHTRHRIIRNDNTVRWVDKKITPILDITGKLIRIDGVIRDITEQKEEEEQHRKSEAMYRQIVETSQEGIWTIDENEKTNFVNQRICGLLGYTPGEMMGKELYDFMDEEGKLYAKACMERRRNGAKENLDIRYLNKTGEDVWANISANPIFDEKGKYKGALAMVVDITQRRAHEEALKKSEANLRTIFDNTDSSYILIDTERRILSFNALAQKYSEDQNHKKLEINKSIKEYFPLERWSFIEQTLSKVEAGEIVNYELSATKENGKVHWYSVRWLNVKNSENTNWGFILANKEITESKTAELEREKITADLIQHNNDLEQFTYIVSHNLRAPVANIIGLSELLSEQDLAPDINQQVVEKISLSIRNIDTVIKDLNHILQARKPVNEKKEKVYFKDLVGAIQTSIYNITVKEKVQFECSFNNIESIFTIRSYIYSIFYNLVSNSIKYRQADLSPIISIESAIAGGKLVLIFKDNGKGIDLNKNGEQVFGLYKRFDTTTEGKGMGLFMVKTQVEALGGTIQIKSKPGEGAEFMIRFSL